MAIRDTFFAEKHKKGENLSKTFEDKVLKNEASEKDSALLITCLKQNEATYPSENLWNFRFFIVFWPREEKTFWITAAHVQIKAYRKSKQRA